MTVSSLLEVYLDVVTKPTWDTVLPAESQGAFALLHSAIGATIDACMMSGDLATGIEEIRSCLPQPIIRSLVRDARMPYSAVRALMAAEYPDHDSLLRCQDLDEAILRNSNFLRSQAPDPGKDQVYLVTLDHLAEMLGSPVVDGALQFKREDLSEGGFEMFDAKRKPFVKILATMETYRAAFKKATKSILEGLDWANVLVTGDLALTTLLYDSPETSRALDTDSNINVFFYGLDAKQSSEKVEHLYSIWERNSPKSGTKRLIVKDLDSITFHSDDNFGQTVRINLKINHSPLDILQKYSLDIASLGYNGHQVLMLPRCARAIETGFNVFTMDLLWGHNLGHRQSSYLSSISKFADWGFGIRILPCYVRSLGNPGEEDLLDSARKVTMELESLISRLQPNVPGYSHVEISSRHRARS